PDAGRPRGHARAGAGRARAGARRLLPADRVCRERHASAEEFVPVARRVELRVRSVLARANRELRSGCLRWHATARRAGSGAGREPGGAARGRLPRPHGNVVSPAINVAGTRLQVAAAEELVADAATDLDLGHMTRAR